MSVETASVFLMNFSLPLQSSITHGVWCLWLNGRRAGAPVNLPTGVFLRSALAAR